MRPVRVLLVDDDPEVRLMLKLHVEQGSCAVVGEAANGREALELVPELEPDVVVMDAMMPVMSGLEATRAIKKRHPHVAVLGFTATPPPHATDLVEAGADAAFDKTDFAKLIATLERWKR